MSNYTIQKTFLEKNKYRFDVVINQEYFRSEVDKEIQRRSSKLKLPGFRPGKVPIDIARAHLVEDAYKEVFNEIIPATTQQILFEEGKSGNNFIIGVDYDFSNEKSEDNDTSIKYSFIGYMIPDIDLSIIKGSKIKYSFEDPKDEEIDDLIRGLIKSALDTESREKLEEKFEITDDMVAKLGYEESKDRDSLKKMVRETMLMQKQKEADDKLALDLLSFMVEKIEFDLPHDLVHREVEKKHLEFTQRLDRLKMKEEDFLKTQGKTLDEMHEIWEQEAIHNIKTDIICLEIAKKEKVEANDEEIQKEIDFIDNDAMKLQYDTPRGREVLAYFISRNKGLQKLIEVSGAKK
jgi:FKBP-type peptidyl-prolyl cis-trans isomerase (trigger factor)